VKPGNYIIIVSSVGYIKQTSNITLTNKDLVLKRISLVENVEMLKGIEVKGTAAQMVVRGDTLEYNATAFKTPENAMVSELIKKLPGAAYTSDGKININGEEIKNIRVDGKKFFSGDIEQAVNNIPADMIEKIQVLEQKSDMARLTGFEDSDTERIINLTTKPNRKKGTFGNFGGGGGVDATLFEKGSVGDDARNNVGDHLRYTGNVSLNLMRGDSQTALTGGLNNLNQARGGRGRGGWSSGAGITETQNIGINNNTILNPKLKIGGDFTINHSSNENNNASNRESYQQNQVFRDTTHNYSTNGKWDSNLRFETEWTIDSLNTIIIQPRMSYGTGNSFSLKDYTYFVEEDTTSWGNSTGNSTNNSLSGGLNVIYNHKFMKKGRSLTLNLNTGFSQSNNESYNYSEKFTRDTAIVRDQFTDNKSDNFNASLRLSFVEPLWNLKNKLEIAASYSNNTTNSEKNQYNNVGSRENPVYSEFNEEYSNTFENIFNRESLEINYQYTDQKYNVMLGLEGQPSQTTNRRYYGNGFSRDTTYGVLNFSPTGRFQYYIGNRKTFVRLDYRGRTQQPSIDQMQPVKNNSDLMQETVGNPLLNPSFSNNFRLMYSAFNDKTFASFSTFVNANFTKDALVSNRIYDNTLKQYNQIVNSPKLPVSLNWNIMFNTPLIRKLLHFTTNTSLGYSTQYSYVSRGVDNEIIDIEHLTLGDESNTKRRNASEGISLTLTQEIIEIGLRGDVSYANSLNNLKKDPTSTWDWTVRGNMVLHLPSRWTISSDIAYSDRAGYTNMSLSEIMWNATIDKQLFKNLATISLKATDILRQRLNIRQTVGDNYIQNNSYNTLPSYFLLTFTYQIKGFGAGNSRGNRRDGFRGGDAPVGIPPGGYQGGGIRMGEGMPMPM
ncbi:MAG: outer membrane beta-barrel protein, partial [Paludibacter sp.]|nr:outer membrane beta-barrel protein [Paludibacter sp.]